MSPNSNQEEFFRARSDKQSSSCTWYTNRLREISSEQISDYPDLSVMP